jgi:hypothetical protein
MRVLIKKSKSPSVNHIYGGIGRVLVKANYQPISWDSKLKPSFDAFDELKPDLFLASDLDLTISDIKCLSENPQTLFVLHRSYPTSDNSWDFDSYGVKPDYQFQNVTQSMVQSGYDSLTCAVDMLNRSKPWDRAMFSVSAIVENRSKFDTYLKPLCAIKENLNIGIFSNEEIGVNQYFGPHNNYESTIYSRSYVSIIFGDNKHESNHRLYECIKYGGLPLVEYNNTDQIILKSTFPMFKNVDDIRSWLKNYSDHPQQKMHTSKSIIAECMKGHTYYDRTVQMFTKLGLQDVVNRIQNDIH